MWGDVDWGDVPTWVTTVSVALGVASYWRYRRTLARDDAHRVSFAWGWTSVGWHVVVSNTGDRSVQDMQVVMVATSGDELAAVPEQGVLLEAGARWEATIEKVSERTSTERMLDLSRAVANGEIDLEDLPVSDLPPETVIVVQGGERVVEHRYVGGVEPPRFVTFRDASGRHWVLHTDGYLRQVGVHRGDKRARKETNQLARTLRRSQGHT